MKKVVFTLMVYCLVFSLFGRSAAAQEYNFQDTDDSVSCSYTVDLEDGKYKYTFTFVSTCPVTSSCIVYYGDYDVMGNYTESTSLFRLSDGSYSRQDDSQGNLISNTYVIEYENDTLLYDASGEFGFFIKAYLQLGGSVSYQIYYLEFTPVGSIPEAIVTNTPVPTATNTPVPTATNTPVPTATNTPVPTATNTPVPTVTNSPIPTATNSPTPTPTIGPVLTLNVSLDGNTATADYYTGGYSPVIAYIELYEITEYELLLEQEPVDPGAGTRQDTLQVGKTYRYRLFYVFDDNGTRYTRFIWSEDIVVADSELDDYQQSGKIHNFRTLMMFIWDRLFALEINVEGFDISFKDIFIWVLIASGLIWLVKKVL